MAGARNYGDLYNIGGWGEPYFVVNAEGHLCVKPMPGHQATQDRVIDVHSVITEATKDPRSKGQFPMILRFPDVLEHRLDSLHGAFKHAIQSWEYGSRYQGVFPVKVNQNKAIVQDLVRFGKSERYGLEAGSKPELLIAMSCLTQGEADAGAYLVCNGYKDADYISLALSARAMKLNAIIVLEMEEELDIVLEESARLGVEPVLGVRAKLLTKIPGHFGSTSGKHGKFGLPADKIYEVAKKLKKKGKLNCLQLLHFHIGSMIPTTAIVGDAAEEAAGIYCKLVKEYGATEMTTLDCGGGLGVDYDGTRSGNSDMSVAYGLQDYASSIVRAVRAVCDGNDVQHPVLCTESGRAMVSHHSMIILEALSAIPEPQDEDTAEELLNKIQNLSSKLPTPPQAAAADSDTDMTTVVSSYAADHKRHAIEMFKLGMKLSKRVTGDAVTIYNYHMNLSIFSLVPDFWGIKQLFPMMPVSRLNEEPTHMATLVDITCDSDGMVAKFIGGGETLPLHPLDTDDHRGGGYYVAVLLSGAYQEALAGKHNLFSGPTLVRVVAVHDSSDLGAFDIESIDMGTTSKQVISTMRYDADQDISRVIRELAEQTGTWPMVEPLLTEGLNTMPYLNKYKVNPTTA